MLCILWFCIVLHIVSSFVYSCLFPIFVQLCRLLPPGGNLFAVNIVYHIISYHIISYHIISYHIISYHIISYHIISYIISYRIILYHIIYHIMYHISYHIISCIIYHIIYHIIYNIMYHISYRIMSYILSYIISCHVMSYHISYHIYIISIIRNTFFQKRRNWIPKTGFMTHLSFLCSRNKWHANFFDNAKFLIMHKSQILITHNVRENPPITRLPGSSAVWLRFYPFEMLRGKGWWLIADVSRQPPICKY